MFTSNTGKTKADKWLDTGTGIAESAVPLVTSMMNSQSTEGDKGAGIGGAIGGVAGSFFGPAGTAIGSTLGSAVGGMIGKGKDKATNKARMGDLITRQNNELDLSYNPDQYGYGGSFYAEEGGMPAMEAGPQEQLTKANIELGEMVVDPASLEIIQEFDNKARFSPHASSTLKEPVGNIVQIPATSVVIPKKMADRYRNGTNITRKSIVANLLKDQANREHGENEEKMKKGGMACGPKMADGGLPVTGRKPNPVIDNILASMGLPAAGQKRPAPFQMGVPFANTGGFVPANAMSATYGSDHLDDEDSKFMAPATVASRNLPATAQPLDLTNTWEAPAGPAPAARPKGNTALKLARSLNFLPTTVGLVDAFAGDPNLRYEDNAAGYDKAASYIKGIPEDINIEGTKAALARSGANNRSMLRGFNSPSIRAELASEQGRVQDKIGEVYQGAVNSRNQIVANKLSQLSGLAVGKGQDREQARVRFNTEKSQDAAVRSSLVQKGISEGVTNFGQMVMDDERIKSLNAFSKYFDINPEHEQLISDDPEARQRITEAIMGGYIPNFQSTTGKTPTDITTRESSVSRDKSGRIKSTNDKSKSTTIKRG